MEIFDSNIALLQKSIELRTKRNELLTSNIANRETPGYKAKDILFDQQLQESYFGLKEGSNDQGYLKQTDPRHFNGKTNNNDLSKVKGQIITSFNNEAGLDGNSVDLDQEMAKLSANQIMFESSTKMISRKLKILKETIIEGGR